MYQVYRNLASILILVSFIFGVTLSESHAAPPAQGPSDSSDQALLNRLNQASGGTVRISYHGETGKVSFIGTTPNRSIKQPSVQGVALSAEDAARSFLKGYGKLFGLRDPDNELALMQELTTNDHRAFVRFQQTHRKKN
jgi:hypothetical protein